MTCVRCAFAPSAGIEEESREFSRHEGQSNQFLVTHSDRSRICLDYNAQSVHVLQVVKVGQAGFRIARQNELPARLGTSRIGFTVQPLGIKRARLTPPKPTVFGVAGPNSCSGSREEGPDESCRQSWYDVT